jgi:hypothetical protein
MDADPNFRLKAFAVLACVMGVFFVAFVAQRIWFWLKTRRRDDVDTSRLAPIVDFGLLALGGLVIWVAIEALILSIITSELSVQPDERRKVAEIEVGRLDPQGGQLNLLFYPVDRAGRRVAEQRRPVLTSGDSFELRAELLRWRGAWEWLGEGGYFQFISLGGVDSRGGFTTEQTSLQVRPTPKTMGAVIFLGPVQASGVEVPCEEGEIYDIYLSPGSGNLEFEKHTAE